MKTTIDVPDAMLHRAKIVAAQRQTTLRELIVSGLEIALRSEMETPRAESAIARLEKGLKLRGPALTREQAHDRKR
jgi:hypothetical protein